MWGENRVIRVSYLLCTLYILHMLLLCDVTLLFGLFEWMEDDGKMRRR